MHGTTFFDALFRKKTFEAGNVMQTGLKRCLSTLDVTSLAVGQMIGAGIYVLTGTVVRTQTGPSIIISFLLAGIAALLSAFSYAEFGARFPRAGSAYTYAYVGVGEIWAFIIGWTVLLEYMIGNAAVARSWSGYFDNLLDNAVSNATVNLVGTIHEGGGFFSRYPDFCAFLVICAVSVAVALGSKISASVTKFFVLMNLAVLSFVVGVGFYYADFSLWKGNDENGVSRFFPYGFSGTVGGAAATFFSFIGFEVLATAGEEAKNPKTTIPLATFSSLALVTTVYILMATALTTMIPYDLVNPTAAYADAFEAKGAYFAKYVVSLGALLGMMNNLIVGMFALPRAVYAMAEDGLIFAFFAKVNKMTQVPLNAIIVFSLINALLAVAFDLEALAELLSIGTLMAYSFVSASVIILRHQCAPINDDSDKMDNGGNLYSWVPFRNYWESLPQGRSICVAVIVMVLSQAWLALNFKLGIFPYSNKQYHKLHHVSGIYGEIYGQISIGFSVLFIILSFTFIVGHEQNSLDLAYKVPLVPLIPSISLLINVLMMVYLPPLTWVRLLMWLAIGFLIYFGYGFGHSKEGKKIRAVVDAARSNKKEEK